MNDDRTLEKVRKLLAKAEAGGTTSQEAEALTAKAAELIAKYGIDQAMLAAADPKRDKVTDKKLVMDPPFARAKVTLLFAVAEPLRVKAVMLRSRNFDGRNYYKFQMHLFGYGADIERVELLFTSLLLQAANAMQEQTIPPGRDKAAYHNSWLEGFAWAIGERLAQIERRAAAEAEQPAGTPGVALVLADRSALAEQARNAVYPDLTNGADRKLTGGGESAGYAAGRKADLGTATRVDRKAAPALR